MRKSLFLLSFLWRTVDLSDLVSLGSCLFFFLMTSLDMDLRHYLYLEFDFLHLVSLGLRSGLGLLSHQLIKSGQQFLFFFLHHLQLAIQMKFCILDHVLVSAEDVLRNIYILHTIHLNFHAIFVFISSEELDIDRILFLCLLNKHQVEIVSQL
jgi:hypothetical protein